jgi:hypothetical protein
MELNNAPQQSPEEGFSLKEKLLNQLARIVTVGGHILIERKIVPRRIVNREENLTLVEGSAGTYAKQIKMAFENDGWPGTNTVELRQIMIEIPSKKDTTKVAESYNRLYHRSIYADMQSELQSTEYNEMMSIVAEKPAKVGKQGRSF